MDPRIVQVIDLKMRKLFSMMNYNHDFMSHWKAIAAELKKGGREEKEDNFQILFKFFQRFLKKSSDEMEKEDFEKLKTYALETFEFSVGKQYLGRKLRQDWKINLSKIGGKYSKKSEEITEKEIRDLVGSTKKKKRLRWEKKKIKEIKAHNYLPNLFEKFIEKYGLWIVGGSGALILVLRFFSQ